MEEQRKNSYDPNEDIVDRMWKRSKNSINLVIVVCNILVFLAVTLTGGTESSRHMMDCGAAYAPLIETENTIACLQVCFFTLASSI